MFKFYASADLYVFMYIQYTVFLILPFFISPGIKRQLPCPDDPDGSGWVVRPGGHMMNCPSGRAFGHVSMPLPRNPFVRLTRTDAG